MVAETPQRSSLRISTETPEVFYLRKYAKTPPCAWSGFAYVHTYFTEENSAHIRRISRKFSLAYIRRNSALCMERFCVRPHKLHRGENLRLSTENSHWRTYAETPPCTWSGFAYVQTYSTEEKSGHIRRNSRKFSLAFIGDNSDSEN